MGFTDNYLALRKKRLEEEEEQKKKGENDLAVNLESPFKLKTAALISPEEAADLAPIGKNVQTEDRKWFEAGAFEDGYNFGDVTKTILGSGVDLVENVASGVIGMGEKVVDAGATLGAVAGKYILPAISDQAMKNEIETNRLWNRAFGIDLPGFKGEEEVKEFYKTGLANFEKDAAEFVAKDLYDEEKIAKAIISNPIKAITTVDADKDSLFGEKVDSLAQSGGQLLATAGLQAVGVPWWLTTGATSYGAESENALRQGATLEEAALSGAVSAGAEILTEKISGGISFGGKTFDEGMTKLLNSLN